MATVLKSKKRARRDFVAEVKATTARVDAGKERLLSAKDLRPLRRGAIKLADWELTLMGRGNNTSR